MLLSSLTLLITTSETSFPKRYCLFVGEVKNGETIYTEIILFTYLTLEIQPNLQVMPLETSNMLPKRHAIFIVESNSVLK